MKSLLVIISLTFLCSDVFAASALIDKGSYLKVFWGTSSRRVLNSDCIELQNPVSCCTDLDTGTCDAEIYYRYNGHCTEAGVPYACCTGEDLGTCVDVYTSEQSVTPNAASVTVTGTFNIGTTYYFSAKAYSTKASDCKDTPCESYYSNETSWVADDTTTVDLEWDKYGYESYVLTTENQLKIVFDEAVYTSTADDNEFSFINCDGCTVTYQSGSGTDTLYYAFSGTIGEAVPFLSYEPVSSIEDSQAVPVVPFEGYLLQEYDGDDSVTVSITTSSPQGVITDSQVITGTASDDTAVTGVKWSLVSYEGAFNGSNTCSWNDPNWTCTITGMSEGTNNVYIVAYDAADNYGYDTDPDPFVVVMNTTGNWYVNNTATGNNDGTSNANAWESFADVIWGTGGVVAGNNLYVRQGNGTYNETFTVGAEGTEGNPINIYLGSNGPITITGTANGILCRNKSYVNIIGYNGGSKITVSKVQGGTDHGILIDTYSADVSNITLQYMRAYQTGKTGIKVNQAAAAYHMTDILITDSYADYNQNSGIDLQFYDNSNSATVRNCLFEYNNQSQGEYQGISVGARISKFAYPATMTQLSGYVYYSAWTYDTIHSAWQWPSSDTGSTGRKLTLYTGTCDGTGMSDGQYCIETAVNDRLYFHINQDPPTDGVWAFYGSAGQVIVENNIIQQNVAKATLTGDGVGIYFDNNSSNNIARFNYIKNNQGDGYVTANSASNDFYGNILVNNGTEVSNSAAIKLRRQVQSGNIYNNSIYNHEGDCMLFLGYNGGSINVYNNICHVMGLNGLNNSENGYTVTENNNIINIVNETYAPRVNVSTGSYSMEVNPQFYNVDSGTFDGFRLNAGSPAINMGADLGETYKWALDPADTSWPPSLIDQGLYQAWDIGAFGGYKNSSGSSVVVGMRN